MDSRINVMQCHCQRAYAVMCDVGAVMCEQRVSGTAAETRCEEGQEAG